MSIQSSISRKILDFVKSVPRELCPIHLVNVFELFLQEVLHRRWLSGYTTCVWFVHSLGIFLIETFCILASMGPALRISALVTTDVLPVRKTLAMIRVTIPDVLRYKVQCPIFLLSHESVVMVGLAFQLVLN